MRIIYARRTVITLIFLSIINVDVFALLTKCRSISHTRRRVSCCRHSFYKPWRGQTHELYLSTSAQDILSSWASTENAITPDQLLTESDRINIESLVQERSKARWEGNYTRADEIRCVIDDIRVAISWKLILESISNASLDEFGGGVQNFRVVITDIPRSNGGGSTWELAPYDSFDANQDKQKEDNVLQLAHAALGMVVSASERGASVNEIELQLLVQRAKDRLTALKQRKSIANFLPGMAVSELHGRKAADAALWFALAGVQDCSNAPDGSPDENLYNALVHMATEELLRFGSKSSCRAKDVLHIVERVAMSGTVGPAAQRLYNVAANCLETKTKAGDNVHEVEDSSVSDSEEEEESNIDYITIIKLLKNSSFGLHTSRPLLGLWRFSTRQRKQKVFFQNAARHYDGRFRDVNVIKSSINEDFGQEGIQYNWLNVFKDPTRPLIIDIGCGMGVSLLGLATRNKGHGQEDGANRSAIRMEWKDHNFLGVDLSRLSIRYADSISKRWGLDNLKFVVDSAESCLAHVKETYPGKTELVMVQFPTPFRFQNSDDVTIHDKGYNSQLPESSASGDFMVTENLLSKIHGALSKSGKLLIQSNCEDVAVHMMNTSVQIGFKPVAFSDAVTIENLDQLGTNVPKRALDWRVSGGERAIGSYWSSLPLLPLMGRTETEVACMLDSKPVNRCILVP